MLTVFGSINLDISVRSGALPRPGETVLGGDALLVPGGKGANQAHAARRFGVPTRLFGAVGDDAFADQALSCMQGAGVDLSGVARIEGAATGLALITVGPSGENTIVVSPGANRAARASQVPDAVLHDSRVLLLQLEVPCAESLALAARAKRAGCRVVLNASPLAADTPPCPLKDVDLLVVNAIELRELCKLNGGAPGSEAKGAQHLAQALRLDVLVTLGAGGSLFCGPGGPDSLHMPALPVQATDTTGAGDTYAGVLGAALAEGLPTDQAMCFASIAAGLACQRAGAQTAQPSRAEIGAHPGATALQLQQPP